MYNLRCAVALIAVPRRWYILYMYTIYICSIYIALYIILWRFSIFILREYIFFSLIIKYTFLFLLVELALSFKYWDAFSILYNFWQKPWIKMYTYIMCVCVSVCMCIIVVSRQLINIKIPIAKLSIFGSCLMVDECFLYLFHFDILKLHRAAVSTVTWIQNGFCPKPLFKNSALSFPPSLFCMMSYNKTCRT